MTKMHRAPLWDPGQATTMMRLGMWWLSLNDWPVGGSASCPRVLMSTTDAKTPLK